MMSDYTCRVLSEGLDSRLCLGHGHTGLCMNDLPMQIIQLHPVIVHDAQPPHTGSREVEAGGRTQASCPDNQHRRPAQPLLAYTCTI